MKIVAIIVTHNPPDGMSERLGAILGQVDQVFVVDNGSNEDSKKALRHANTQFTDNIEILWNEENIGLAAAINQGVKRALNQNADWILLLDHDSQPEPDMVVRMFEAYNSYPEKEKIGLIAPEIKEQNTVTETRYLVPKGKFWFQRITIDAPYSDEVLSVITSGSLINAELFNNIGFMPEHFFIDYIDHAFCLNMRKQGYRILLVKNAMIQHRLGEKTTHNMVGMKIVTPHHNAFRRYYIFRNRIWVWKRHFKTFPNFILHDLFAACFDILRVVIYEEQKLQKLKAIAKGVYAGCCPEPK